MIKIILILGAIIYGYLWIKRISREHEMVELYFKNRKEKQYNPNAKMLADWARKWD